NQAKRGVPDTAQRLVLGLLRSPTQDKPARHRGMWLPETSGFKVKKLLGV
ncbi:hypothetical protein ACVKS2_004924, partial [Pseudomonas sp. PvP125]